MAGIKVGDRVDITRTEAARFAVESRQSVQVTAGETLRERHEVGLNAFAVTGEEG